MKNRKRRNRRKQNRIIGTILMVLAALLTVALVSIIIFVVVQTVKNLPKEEDPSNSPIIQLPAETVRLSEEIFFVNHTREPIGMPRVNGATEAMRQRSLWQNQAFALVNYHMVIVEEETYGATKFEGERSLSKTQSRQIDVYSTLDDQKQQWYLIEIQETGCFHISRYSIAPGIYFFRADGNSPIYSIKGEMTGEEKDDLIVLLRDYLLSRYTIWLEARMGNLQIQSYSIGTGITAMTLKSSTGTMMYTGKQDQLTGLTANYTEDEGDTVYSILMEVSHGETFDVGKVDLEQKSPYPSKGPIGEIVFWNGEEPFEATLEEVQSANEVWKKMHIPKEFSAKAYVNLSTTVLSTREVQIRSYYIIYYQKQELEGSLYHKIVIDCKNRSVTDFSIVPGTYLFNDEFIWTDIGIIRTENAPRLYQALKSFGTENVLNANWQIGLCGDMYLEAYTAGKDYQISLIEKGEGVSGYPNTAKVITDKEFQMTAFETHTNYRVKDKCDYMANLEVTLDYERKTIEFPLPNVS